MVGPLCGPREKASVPSAARDVPRRRAPAAASGSGSVCGPPGGVPPRSAPSPPHRPRNPAGLRPRRLAFPGRPAFPGSPGTQGAARRAQALRPHSCRGDLEPPDGSRGRSHCGDPSRALRRREGDLPALHPAPPSGGGPARCPRSRPLAVALPPAAPFPSRRPAAEAAGPVGAGSLPAVQKPRLLSDARASSWVRRALCSVVIATVSCPLTGQTLCSRVSAWQRGFVLSSTGRG